MPIDGLLLRKFQTLKERFESVLRDHSERQEKRGPRSDLLHDPLDIDPIFDRWRTLYAELCATDPELGSAPAPLPGLRRSDNQAAHDGRGGYANSTVLRLERDMSEAWTLATHPSKQLSQVTLGAEGIFLAGTPFDAMLAVSSIIRAATQHIIVIDGYVSERTLQLLSQKAPTVNVKILTYSLTAADRLHANAFVTQYGATLQIRTSKRFHDRFIVIDDVDFFHFGTSIKDAAVKNTFMFSRIQETDIQATLRSAFAAEWGNAPVVL